MRSQVATHPRLLADIGGTHARFAIQNHQAETLSHLAVYKCAQFETLESCVKQYLADQRPQRPVACAMGIATQIMGDWVSMPNNPWAFSTEALRAALAFEQLILINDFTALALSLPDLVGTDLHCIQPGRAAPGSPLALIGPGTGLGVSGLLTNQQGSLVAISGEGGHVTLSADNPLEVAVVEGLKRRFGHASAERALSGQGLINLYQALCAIENRTCDQLQSHDIVARAQLQSDKNCILALNLFFAFLGSTCGNLALTLGARGGIFIGGGIVPGLLPALEQSQFLSRYLQKGRYSEYLRQIPMHVITADASPALLGAGRALDNAMHAHQSC
jgi:glucokinase